MKERYLTIFVAVYNIEQYLDRLFDCIKKQTFEDYEVLIMDDGSTDNSLEICKKYAQLDDRIRVVELEHHGLAATRMETYKRIRTKYAVCIDGDDWVEPDYLKHLVDAQKKYDADLVTSNAITDNEEGKEEFRFPWRKEELFNKSDYPNILPQLLLEDRLNYMHGRIYRSELLKGIDVGKEDMGEDTRTVIQYLLKTNKIVVIEDYDYHYIRYVSRSVTAKLEDDLFYKVWAINKFVYDLMEENGLLNNEMIKSIDTRIIAVGKFALDKIYWSDAGKKEKFLIADKIIGSKEYVESYNRQNRMGNIKKLDFKPIPPGKGKNYMKHMIRGAKLSRIKRNIKQVFKVLK